MSVDWKKHARKVIAALGADTPWTHASVTTTVTGIYLEPFRELQLGDAPIGGSQPRFVAMAADMPGLAVGDTVTVNGAAYTVRVPELDVPSGVVVLHLEKP